MTDNAVHIEISSSNGGMENEVEIRDEQDLQVAVEALQLAARYEFDEEVNVEFDKDSLDEELRDLCEKVEQLDEELDGVEEDVGILIEEVSDSVEKGEIEEIRGSVQELKDEINSLHAQDSPQDNDGQDEQDVEEQEPESPDSENPARDKSDFSIEDLELPEIVDQDKVEIDPPYSYDEFKSLSELRQKAVIYDTVVEIQPATKVEVADEILESDVTDSNGKRAQYVGYRLENKISNLSRRRRPLDQGKDPWEYAESGFDFQVSSEQDEEEEELDLDESQQSNESVERNPEAMAEDAPEPDADEEEEPDPEEQQAEDEDTGEGSDPVSDVEDIQWKSIQEAVGEYKDDHGLKYLINREHEKRYTSPMMAQSFASTNQAEDWAAVEELPEGY